MEHFEVCTLAQGLKLGEGSAFLLFLCFLHRVQDRWFSEQEGMLA
jgi:hypothetical protein